MVQSDLETTLKPWASLAFDTQLYSVQGTATHLQQNMYLQLFYHTCFCKATYPSKLNFQVVKAALMQDAKPIGFGFGFPFVWAAPPYRSKQSLSDCLASPSQQQPWRLNPKIVGLFSALLCRFNRWSVCSVFQWGCQVKWWFLWCTHLTARNWNKTTNLFHVGYWITTRGLQLSVATSLDSIQTSNLKQKWSLLLIHPIFRMF